MYSSEVNYYVVIVIIIGFHTLKANITLQKQTIRCLASYQKSWHMYPLSYPHLWYVTLTGWCQNMLSVLERWQYCHAPLTTPLVHDATSRAELYNHDIATESVFQSMACTWEKHMWAGTTSTRTFPTHARQSLNHQCLLCAIHTPREGERA